MYQNFVLKLFSTVIRNLAKNKFKNDEPKKYNFKLVCKIM